MLHKLLFTSFLFIGLISSESQAQTTVAFQGGEGTAADNWNYNTIYDAGGPLTPGAVNSNANTGSYSIRAGGGNNVGCSGGSNCAVGGGATGCPSHGKSVQFESLNISCLSDVQISCYHRSHPYCSGNGFDSGEKLYFEVELNSSGTWSVVGTVGGYGDYGWNYSNNPAGSPSSGFTLPNPFVYNVPAGTNSVAFRVRTNTNRSDEVFYIDDVTLTTTSTIYSFPGIPGLWNGEVSTDWHNPCNWDERTVPTGTTDVTIPNGTTNYCEVAAGNTADCNNIIIDNELHAEFASSVITTNGNLTITPNGLLDMSLGGAAGGILNLYGNWSNNGDETNFDEGRSLVRFLGGSTQTINTLADNKENFYRIQLNKTVGSVLTTNENIIVDPLNLGGALSMFILSGGMLDLNTHFIHVMNDNSLSLSRTGGGVVAERTDNTSRIIRSVNNNSGNYIFPFMRTDGSYIPFVYNPASGNSGEISVTTYPTPPNNLPWPVTPVLVTNLISGIGLSPDNRNATVDRFWHIESTGSPVAELTFSYGANELPIAPFNNALTMKAQQYGTSSNLWQPYLPGQGANFFFVTAPGVSQFGTWTLTNELSPLPVELLYFDASLNKEKIVDISWATATEINNDYFTVERSGDGINFNALTMVNGAGNSNEVKYYNHFDISPMAGISYYRLKQTDFDGTVSYSPIATIKLHENPTDVFSIFPNPAGKYFYIRFNELISGTKISIRDISGRLINSFNIYDKENSSEHIYKVDCSNINSGIYFISAETGHTIKLVINR